MCKENDAKTAPLCIRGAIFDMDGTLLDSMWIWEHYASQYIRMRGLIPANDLDARLDTATLAEAADLLRREYNLPESTAETVADIERTVKLLYERVLPKPGVMEMLERFRRAGVRMAVATLTEREDAEHVLSRLGILPYLAGIFTCSEAGAPKTCPNVFFAALAALGTRREETPVFEDAAYALRTAQAAGFPTIAVCDASQDIADVLPTAVLIIRDYRGIAWESYLA